MSEGNLAQWLIDEVAKKQKLIVFIGDEIKDVWVHGRVGPCQDGCSKFIEESRCTTFGGAANANNCLSKWAIRTRLYSAGGHINDVRRNSTKTRFVDPMGRIVYRWDADVRVDGPYHWTRQWVLEMLPFASAVVLTDYDKGLLTPEFIREIASLCSSKHIPCVADAKRAPEVYEGCIVKANATWWDHYIHNILNPIPRRWVVTQGEYPPFGGDSTPSLLGSWTINSTPDVPCVNHVGAGDCFTAHLALALAYGFSLKDAAQLAHSAGRVYVQHPHNRPPLPAEVVADLEARTPTMAQGGG